MRTARSGRGQRVEPEAISPLEHEPDLFARQHVAGCHRLQSVEQGQSPWQMNDHGAQFRHVCVVESRIPSSGHRLRTTAALLLSTSEAVTTTRGFRPGTTKPASKSHQKRRFSVASARRPAPVRKALRLKPAGLHRAQVLLLRRDEYQARAGDASRLIDECTQFLPRRCDRRKVRRRTEAALGDNTFIRLVRRFQSDFFEGIRALFRCDRPPPRSCSASCWCAAGTPASAIHLDRSQ